MRMRNVVFVCLLATFGAVQLGGCATSPEQRTTGQVVDDGAVTARVKTALAREAGLGEAMNVNVNTYRGVVQLSGFVESEQVARRAEEIAKAVDGVQSVKNDLRVAPSRR
jgi:hyperosmotically inducible protein